MNYNGNCNNNNKDNSNGVVPVLAITDESTKGSSMSTSLYLPSQYTYKDILIAYLQCRKMKRNSEAARIFEMDYERKLLKMLEQINSNNYKIGRFTAFTVSLPKPREIWAPCFRDRIEHHLIYNSIAPWFEARFIEDTFSCIPERGTFWASKRVEDMARSITENWAKDCWVLQMDVANFFVTINREILWSIVKNKIGTDSLTSNLIKQIIMHDPTIKPNIRKDANFSIIEPHKSLWNAKPGCGLPIGVLTSQFFSNVYMDPADKFAKHVLKIKKYVRYVDDIIVLSRDKDELYWWAEQYDKFLRENLSINLHPKKILIYNISEGIDFVGRVVYPFRTITRQRVLNGAKKAARALTANILSEKVYASLQSYLGYLTHDSTFNIRKKLTEDLDLPMFFKAADDYSKLHKM